MGSRPASRVVLGLSAVIVAVTAEQPRLLTVPGERPALPSGRLDPDGDRTLERALRRWVREQTHIELGYVEQLYSLGDRGRGPRMEERLVTVAYLALVREGPVPAASGAQWLDFYSFLPWEDFREGPPPALAEAIIPALDGWTAGGPPKDRHARRERVQIMFGRHGSPWDVERVLERYELLYEAGLIPEAGVAGGPVPGDPMDLDHRRIAAQALGRLRGKLRYRPVVFELLPSAFTLGRLQQVVEALSGVRLHSQNFRRLLAAGGLVEPTGEMDPSTGGRPAAVHRFRREVLAERPAPGVGLPGLRTSG
ncbi:MAG: hypothetical protein FJW79_02595 [Actinobacteria bacterium]|nr:hypothetical protein [Actinomycetota bacterium]